MRLLSSAVVCGLFVFATQVHADPVMEVWRVVEGPQGALTGVWNVKRDGDKISGNARMMRAGQAPLTYGFAGEVKGGQLIVERVGRGGEGRGEEGGEGRARCRYIGTPVTEGVMNGTTLCGAQGSVWQVTIAPRDAQ